MSPISFGPSDVNNPRYVYFGQVPESFWLTKALIFDYDWIVRELAQTDRVMPDHADIGTTLAGFVETFRLLRGFEVRLAMTSNLGQAEVVRELSRLGLANNFDYMRCSEDPGSRKPHPELLINTLEMLGIPPVKAVAFETTEEGIQSARAAKIFCVSMKGCPPADHSLKSFIEKPILALLEDIDRVKREQLRGHGPENKL